MRVMSLSDFSEWQRKAGEKEYIFDSDNNEWLTPYCFHTCLRFRTASVSRTSNRIAFRSDGNVLTLRNVKEVLMFDDSRAVGTVFEIVCEISEQNSPGDTWYMPPGQRRYRFLAD